MPDQYRVIASGEAFDDLNQILDFIAEVSPQAAARMVDRLWHATQSLERFPNRYKIYQHRRRRDLVVRSMPIPPFVIYYRVVEQSKVVRILTVRHGARQKPERFDQ